MNKFKLIAEKYMINNKIRLYYKIKKNRDLQYQNKI